MADGRLQLEHHPTEAEILTIHILPRQHVEKMPPYKSFGLLSVVDGNITKWALIFNCNIFVRVKSLLSEKNIYLQKTLNCVTKGPTVCGIMRLSEKQPRTPIIFLHVRIRSSVKKILSKKVFQVEVLG